jgi:hypothetical protein
MGFENWEEDWSSTTKYIYFCNEMGQYYISNKIIKPILNSWAYWFYWVIIISTWF